VKLQAGQPRRAWVCLPTFNHHRQAAMTQRRSAMRTLWAILGLAALAPPLAATPLPQGEAERACWLAHTRERTRPNTEGLTSVDFSNLRDGYVLRSPFLVAFAVRGMGVAPAGAEMPKTGHHHILIDTRLPVSVTDGLPFSDTHRHFGKGQTFTVLDLPPGDHTLRLLFADAKHRPYFVFSPEIRVKVAGKRSAGALRIDPAQAEASCQAWYEDEQGRPPPPGEWVGFGNVRDGEPVVSPFALHFMVQGWGVSAVGAKAERSGHFVLEIRRDAVPVQTVDLVNGATQATLNLPNGNYLARLRFVDAKTGRDLVPAVEQSLPVVGQERM
jgi:hypothetical protein